MVQTDSTVPVPTDSPPVEPLAVGDIVVRDGEPDGPRGRVLAVSTATGRAQVAFAGLATIWVKLGRLVRVAGLPEAGDAVLLARVARRIADLQDLLAWLETRPDVPLSRYGSDPWDYHVGPLEGPVDDAAGIARVKELAALIGGEYSSNEDGTHHHARRWFGGVAYQASYITRQRMAEHRKEVRRGAGARAARRARSGS